MKYYEATRKILKKGLTFIGFAVKYDHIIIFLF